jgi:hypothetical protein
MRRAYFWVVAGVAAAALLSCDGGDNGGSGPTPGGGGGPGVWITDKDMTVHKVSFAGEALLTVEAFV